MNGPFPSQPAADPEEEVELVPIDAYREQVLAGVELLAATDVPLIQAHGLVCAADVVATTDLPSFVSSAMDGYAVRSADVADARQNAGVALRVIGEVRMGRPTTLSLRPGEAAIVPTGGIVPEGADAVVPIELTRRDADDVVVVLRDVPPRKHVRPCGEDARAGDVVVPRGRRIFAPDIGVLAACGFDRVPVHPAVRVGVVSTGDELVRPPSVLDAGQIFDSNAFTLIAAIGEAGAVPVDGGNASDEPGALIAALEAIENDVDVIVCSGGVSMGERDPVKRAFEDGADITFAQVGMQPGRPQASGSWRGTPFFGLPGNPVSVFVSFEAFVRPALMKMMGRTDERPVVEAELDGELDAPARRGRFARVVLRRDGTHPERYLATPEGGHGSNLLATFARADGLLFVPAGSAIGKGERCQVTLIRSL